MVAALPRRSFLALLGLSAPAAMAGESGAGRIEGHGAGHRFGLAKAKPFAEALRKLADDIEHGGTYLQHFEMRSVAGLEDFLVHEITMKFVRDDDKAA